MHNLKLADQILCLPAAIYALAILALLRLLDGLKGLSYQLLKVWENTELSNWLRQELQHLSQSGKVLGSPPELEQPHSLETQSSCLTSEVQADTLEEKLARH
jgi:hypothetical protein